MERRRFLQFLVGGITGLAVGPELLLASSVPNRSYAEYDGTLDEFLFVYDQCSAPHLLREMVEILRNAPPDAQIHVLVSSSLAEIARRQLTTYGLGKAQLLISGEEGISGDWGRDVFQLGRDSDGKRLLGVPWFKAAHQREELDRGWRKFKGLADDKLAVQLIPASFEGGNLMTDLRDGRRVLLAGSTIAVETRALYRLFYDSDPGDEGVARILAEGLGVGEVTWLGPRNSGQLDRQAHYGFHIDMGLTLVAPGVAVVAHCDPQGLTEDDHRVLLGKEAERTLAALDRRETAGLPWPEDLALPRAEGERKIFLQQSLQQEREGIRQVASEWEIMGSDLTALGYTVHRIEADPRRVRRFQSHTNAIVTGDRLLMPIFPAKEHVHGWLLHPADGRDRIDVDLGLSDNEYELTGDNLAAFRLYKELHPDVRVVRDYFYLASGNVHCVIGRMT